MKIHLREVPNEWALCTLKPVLMTDDVSAVTCEQCLRRVRGKEDVRA